MRAWLVDPLPNSPNRPSENDMADSKDNKEWYLVSERVKYDAVLEQSSTYELADI